MISGYVPSGTAVATSLCPGRRCAPGATPCGSGHIGGRRARLLTTQHTQNYSDAGSADGRRPSAAWTLQTPALRSRGWGCLHLLLALRSVGAVSCPGQMGFPHAMMSNRLWCYGEMSSRDNPQDKCLQSVRAFHRSIRIQAAPATVVGAMPTLGCLYTRWARRWVA